MKTVYVYSGTFSPPTFGHLSIARQATAIFPELIILCSKNPDKAENWFTPEECKQLWQSYRLPKNVKVMTQADFKPMFNKGLDLVLVRGIRGAIDLEPERAVMLLNYNQFNIKKFFYIFSPAKNKNISSSKARQAATDLNLKSLSRQVSPLVISALLEKVLQAKNIFLVVGRPGSGKSTFLKMLSQIDARNYWINTDNFNQTLRPLLVKKFGEEDLVKLALKDEKQIKKTIVKPWFKLLVDNLKQVPASSNILVEIAYGLQADKRMFRFLGGKIIHIYCHDANQNRDRIIERGTPQLASFIEKIPDYTETLNIAAKHQLSLINIDTNCTWPELSETVIKINDTLNK